MADSQSTPPPSRPKLPKGMRYHGRGIQACFSVQRKRTVRGFPIDTPLEKISAWRTVARDQVRRGISEEVVCERVIKMPSVDAPKPLAGVGFVYFIQAEQYVKIGWAVDVDARRRNMQTFHYAHLKLVGTIPSNDPRELEYLWHARYGEHRVRGEWFRLTEPMARAIRASQMPDQFTRTEEPS